MSLSGSLHFKIGNPCKKCHHPSFLTWTAGVARRQWESSITPSAIISWTICLVAWHWMSTSSEVADDGLWTFVIDPMLNEYTRLCLSSWALKISRCPSNSVLCWRHCSSVRPTLLCCHSLQSACTTSWDVLVIVLSHKHCIRWVGCTSESSRTVGGTVVAFAIPLPCLSA